MRILAKALGVGAVALLGGGAALLVRGHAQGRVHTLPVIEVVAELPTAEQLELEQSARNLLDGAVKAGAWRDSDIEAFRGQFRKLTELQQAGLAQTLSAAVNDGKIKLDPAKMPW